MCRAEKMKTKIIVPTRKVANAFSNVAWIGVDKSWGTLPFDTLRCLHWLFWGIHGTAKANVEAFGIWSCIITVSNPNLFFATVPCSTP